MNWNINWDIVWSRLDSIASVVFSATFLNNTILMVFFVMFFTAIIRESKNPKSPIQWYDMLLDKTQNKLSLSKVGQFLAIVISNWAIMYFVQQVPKESVASVLTWLWPMWLAFAIGSWGYSSWLKANSTNKDEDKK